MVSRTAGCLHVGQAHTRCERFATALWCGEMRLLCIVALLALDAHVVYGGGA
jgi:hypothetical protein